MQGLRVPRLPNPANTGSDGGVVPKRHKRGGKRAAACWPGTSAVPIHTAVQCTCNPRIRELAVRYSRSGRGLRIADLQPFTNQR